MKSVKFLIYADQTNKVEYDLNPLLSDSIWYDVWDRIGNAVWAVWDVLEMALIHQLREEYKNEIEVI